MKDILNTEYVTVPEGVTVEVKHRSVRVKGVRGVLQRDFPHVRLDMKMVTKQKLRVDAWFKNSKELSVLRTICSHVKNMITGVTKGFEYKMRAVYAHFPINLTIADTKKQVDIRNFLGEKVTRTVLMHTGVTIEMGIKDELVLRGNDIEKVSLSAARVMQSTLVKGKDIRKFLDGIYVSERSTIKK